MKSMTTLFLYLLVLCTFFKFETARAETTEDEIMFYGVNISAFVDYYRPAVKTLEKTVTVFNWSRGANEPFWAEEHSQDDVELILHARNRIRSFWRNFGDKRNMTGGMYGFGLYAATDPVLTNSYGGGGVGWVLLQIELPIGFKLIDVTNDDVLTDPNALAKMQVVSTKFKCPESGHINDFFVHGGRYLDPLCKALTQKVFSDILEIGGFGYGYITKTFRACKKNDSSGEDRAFVLTNPNSIHSEDIRSYTAKTFSDRENRIRIQSLFFKTLEVDDTWGIKDVATQKINTFLSSNPRKSIQSSMMKCAETCILSARICEAVNKCEDLTFESLPGGIMTTAEAKLTEARKLLWPDMEGVKLSPKINSWLLQNKYACDGKLPYSAAPTQSQP